MIFYSQICEQTKAFIVNKRGEVTKIDKTDITLNL